MVRGLEKGAVLEETWLKMSTAARMRAPPMERPSPAAATAANNKERDVVGNGHRRPQACAPTERPSTVATASTDESGLASPEQTRNSMVAWGKEKWRASMMGQAGDDGGEWKMSLRRRWRRI